MAVLIDEAVDRLTVTEKLSPALLAPRPEEGLLERFSRLSGEAVLYLAREGQVLASAGELPARSIARQLRGVRDSEVTFRLGRWSVHARSVAASTAQHVVGESTWLVRGLRSGNAPDPGDPSAAALTDLLLVVKEQRNNIAKAQLINASELLEGFRSDEADKAKVIQGMLGRGFSQLAQIRLIVAGLPGDGFRAELHREPIAVAGDFGAPLVIGNLQGRLAVLTTDSDQIGRLAATLPPPVGLSAASRRPQPVASSSGARHWWLPSTPENPPGPRATMPIPRGWPSLMTVDRWREPRRPSRRPNCGPAWRIWTLS